MRNLIVFLVFISLISPAEAETKIVEKSVADLQTAMAGGQLTSVELVGAYFDRIEAYDRKGPQIRALIKTLPRAEVIHQATLLDYERKHGRVRGPLHGIPVIVKDSIDVLGLPTSGGATILKDAYPKADAFLIARLRNAGAILIGKTNLDELQMQGVGYSTLGGQTKNPYAFNRIPGGSSAGSGAGITANFAAIGIGADTNGSLRAPAANNSLCALRPTVGLISRRGSLPGTDAIDVLGPMTKNMSDLAATLDVLVGVDPADPITLRSVGKVSTVSYTSYLNKNALMGARIGYIKNFFDFNRSLALPGHFEAWDVSKKVLTDLQAAGALLTPIELSPANDPLLSRVVDVSSYLETGKTHLLWDRYLPALQGKSFASFSEFVSKGWGQLFAGSPLDLKLFKQIATIIKLAANYNPAAEATANAKQIALQQYFASQLDSLKLDAIVLTPTGKMARITDGGYVNEYVKGLFNIELDQPGVTLSSNGGLPTLSVPAGFTPDNIPLGLEFVGRAFSEPTLIRLGYAYEQATKHRRLPPSTPALPK